MRRADADGLTQTDHLLGPIFLSEANSLLVTIGLVMSAIAKLVGIDRSCIPRILEQASATAPARKEGAAIIPTKMMTIKL